MKTYIELYEALEKGDVKLNFGICDLILHNLPLEKWILIQNCFIDWRMYSHNRSFSQVYISDLGKWNSTRKNLLLLLACYDNEI